MSRLLSAVPAQPAAAPGQTSRENRFDRAGVRSAGSSAARGRGVEARRRAQVLPVIEVSRHAATVFWADLVRRRCVTRERCAVMFEVTFQTACNWFDGFSCPTGDKVIQAQRWWPEDFHHDR